MLKKFYGVTFHRENGKQASVSVYKIQVTKKDNLVVEKIALLGESKIKIGEQLTNGYTLGISHTCGLQRYEARNGKRVDEVNTISWGGGTSELAGLFAYKKDAMKCFRANNLEVWDERFITASEEVIYAIGSDEPPRILLDSRLHSAVEHKKVLVHLRAVRN